MLAVVGLEGTRGCKDKSVSTGYCCYAALAVPPPTALQRAELIRQQRRRLGGLFSASHRLAGWLQLGSGADFHAERGCEDDTSVIGYCVLCAARGRL